MSISGIVCKKIPFKTLIPVTSYNPAPFSVELGNYLFPEQRFRFINAYGPSLCIINSW